jgi:hypothetical protein
VMTCRWQQAPCSAERSGFYHCPPPYTIALWGQNVPLWETVTGVAPLIFPMSYLSFDHKQSETWDNSALSGAALLRCKRNKDFIVPSACCSHMFCEPQPQRTILSRLMSLPVRCQPHTPHPCTKLFPFGILYIGDRDMGNWLGHREKLLMFNG